MVVAWLKQAGATLLDGGDLPASEQHAGRELTIYFPRIGTVEFWPTEIRPDEYVEGTPRWKRAMLARRAQQTRPGQPQIDADRSPVAGLRFPELRDGRYWVAGKVWFPTSNLKGTFPELHRVCQKLERWLGRFTTVYDNRKGEDQVGFGYQLCVSGVVQRIVALPAALELLRNGAFMVDPACSIQTYLQFRRRLELAGDKQ